MSKHKPPKSELFAGVPVHSIVLGLFIVTIIVLLSLFAVLMSLGISGMSEALVAVLGFAGVFVTGYFGYLQSTSKQHELEQAERELQFQAAYLDFGQFLTEWGETIKDIEQLMEETSISGFLIFRAWNGYLEPRWTTAVLQIRKGNQEVVSYVHFELDNDYVNRLRDINRDGRIVFRTEDLPVDAAIRGVYELEGVKVAAWYQLLNQQIPGTQSQAVTYCSFATHSDNIDQTVLTKCSIIASRLKGVAGSFK